MQVTLTRVSLGTRTISSLLIVAATLCSVSAAQVQSSSESGEAYVPHHLLGLVHAPEVHEELQLSDAQVKQLEALFQSIDGDWLRARNLPPEKNAAVIDQLEKKVRAWFQANAKEPQWRRLQQLELRAQGIRILLRDDVKRQLALSDSQFQRFLELAKATQQASDQLSKAARQNTETQQLRNEVRKAQKAEEMAFAKVINPNQMRKLQGMLGPSFNTGQLSRVYPMAPELSPVENWINGKPVTLKQLRGKVVLLHFYAFQCHNCQANFDVYRRWHEKYGDDVVVIGIQTPETARERDPLAVSNAAKKEDLKFPILIDLESSNWRNWSNTMWPTVYVIDQRGYLRQWWQGELRWQGATGDQMIEKLVDKLLSEDEEGRRP